MKKETMLLFIMILLCIPAISFSITRNEVITKASEYATNPGNWEVKERNILDVKKKIEKCETGTYKIDLGEGATYYQVITWIPGYS